MMKTGFKPAISAALVLAALGSFGMANAQSAVRPAPQQKSLKPGKPDIVVNCCRCVGGKNDAVSNISTGVASWTVSTTPTPPPPPPPSGYSAPGAVIEAMPTNRSPQVAPVNIGVNPLPGTWATIAGASWLQPGANSNLPNGHWTYVLKVQVPNCTIPQKVTISGKLAADDIARMFVDHASGSTQTLVGNPFAGFAADGSTTRNFSAVLNPSLPGGFTRPGTYFIRVELDNLGGGPSGMVLSGNISGACSDSLVRNPPKDAKEAEAERPTADCPTC